MAHLHRKRIYLRAMTGIIAAVWAPLLFVLNRLLYMIIVYYLIFLRLYLIILN